LSIFVFLLGVKREGREKRGERGHVIDFPSFGVFATGGCSVFLGEGGKRGGEKGEKYSRFL